MIMDEPEKKVVCFKTVAELRPLNSATVLKHTRNFGVPNGLLGISRHNQTRTSHHCKFWQSLREIVKKIRFGMKVARDVYIIRMKRCQWECEDAIDIHERRSNLRDE